MSSVKDKGHKGEGPGGDGRADKGKHNMKKLSHALSWALRHSAPAIGLPINPGGWVPVQKILASKHPRLKGVTLEAMEEVVATSDKKRFALSMRPSSEFESLMDAHADWNDNEEILCIRANQGHSIKTIDPSLLLRKLSAEELLSLPCIVHGSHMEAWKSISKQGLSKMNRTHIHFATGLPEDKTVISGMRRNASIFIYVDPEACMKDGIEFFISENGVVLTDGIDGILPTKYFIRVTDSNSNAIMTTGNDEKS